MRKEDAITSSPAGRLADAIDRILPQTQCAQCGYAGCRPYAEAIAAGDADINQCPPGGDAGIRRLAVLLERDYKPLNPANGPEKPRAVARIDEARCIGCTLCIQACPVDAIAGAPRYMHTVIADLCTGCDLCLAPCPVDCIVMLPVAGPRAGWDAERADAARERFQQRNARLAREEQERIERLARQAPDPRDRDGAASAQEAKRAILQAAIERARAQRGGVQARNIANLTQDQQDQIAAADARRAQLAAARSRKP